AAASVHDAVERWLQQRPVTRVEFCHDFQVKLTLAAPGDELFDTFRSAATSQKEVPVPADDAAWDAVRQRFVARPDRIGGHAAATMPTHVASAVELPSEPPDWVDRQIDAQGAAKPK